MALLSPLLARVHKNIVLPSRIWRLATLIAPLCPRNARVLDIGCGDGSLGEALAKIRPDLEVEGVERFVRPFTKIPVVACSDYDLPFDSGSFDVCLVVDTLHHADDPEHLLSEALRVSAQEVVVKDHYADSRLSHWILQFMDKCGNERIGLPIPKRYFSRKTWRELMDKLNTESCVSSESLQLYPWWLDWLFGGKLHFLTAIVSLERHRSVPKIFQRAVNQ